MKNRKSTTTPEHVDASRLDLVDLSRRERALLKKVTGHEAHRAVARTARQHRWG